MTISDEFGSYFCNGEWTVSYSGRPYHNLALDEAHECVITCRLKQITSWPSYFRLVELSNFMAYLDTVVGALQKFLFRRPSKPLSEYQKRFVCQRATRIDE